MTIVTIFDSNCVNKNACRLGDHRACNKGDVLQPSPLQNNVDMDKLVIEQKQIGRIESLL